MLALILAVALAPADTAVDKDSLKKFQGTWQVAEHEHGGKKSPAKELANLTLEVTEAKAIVRDGIDLKEQNKITHLKTGKPNEIDLQVVAGPDLDKVIKGIWKVDGDTLTVCIAEPSKDRPKTFEAKEGTGHSLMVFKPAKKK